MQSYGNYFSGKSSLSEYSGTDSASEIYLDDDKLIGNWAHIAGVYKLGSCKYFINGNQYGHILQNCTTAMNSILQNSNIYTRVGSEEDSSADYSSNMLIDDFCIISKALWDKNFMPPTNYLLSDAELIKDSNDYLYGYK